MRRGRKKERNINRKCSYDLWSLRILSASVDDILKMGIFLSALKLAVDVNKCFKEINK